MGSAKLDAMNEEAIFEAEYREEQAPQRKLVVLRKKIQATSKDKRANKARFKHRTTPGFKAKNSSQRNN